MFVFEFHSQGTPASQSSSRKFNKSECSRPEFSVDLDLGVNDPGLPVDV
jgi:hypothetical protein